MVLTPANSKSSSNVSWAVSDFETEYDAGTNTAAVWLWDICHGDYEHVRGQSIEEWWEAAKGFSEIYFHNLSFDGSYILCFLDRMGYTVATNPKNKNPGQYWAAISGMGKWFFVDVLTPEGVSLMIKDSAKKIPLSVSAIAKVYSKTREKGSIDYITGDLHRVPTEREWAYCAADTEIVYEALQQHFKAGMTKLTLPSDALAIMRQYGNFDQDMAVKWWATHAQADAFCRKALAGGISWVNPQIAGVTVYGGMVYDCNAMYPHQMRDKAFPAGVPHKWERKPSGDLWIAEVEILGLELKRGHAPCIRIRADRRWHEQGVYDGILYLTSIDVETLEEHYSYEDIKFVKGYGFDAKLGVFKDFVDEYTHRKETSKGGERAINKLVLNSTYGKLGTNPVRTAKIPMVVDEIVKFVAAENQGKPVNVAAGAMVTAYARSEWAKVASSSTGTCYGDTDSVHLAEIDGIKPEFAGAQIHPTKTGFWSLESTFELGKFLRQKTYIEIGYGGEIDVKACGMPERSKAHVTLSNFEIGNKFPGKLIPKMVKGGKHLFEGEFTIRAPILEGI